MLQIVMAVTDGPCRVDSFTRHHRRLAIAKSAKSNVKPFQIDWPRSYWWGLRTAPIPLAAGVDKPLVSRATTLVLVLIAASALTWVVFIAIHGLYKYRRYTPRTPKGSCASCSALHKM
jgi:hypothetical protein